MWSSWFSLFGSCRARVCVCVCVHVCVCARVSGGRGLEVFGRFVILLLVSATAAAISRLRLMESLSGRLESGNWYARLMCVCVCVCVCACAASRLSGLTHSVIRASHEKTGRVSVVPRLCVSACHARLNPGSGSLSWCSGAESWFLVGVRG